MFHMLSFIMVRSFFIISLFIITIHARDTPDWINAIPQDSDYYWARASSATRNLSEREYMERANQRAFINISMSIRTAASAKMESKFTEVRINDDDAFLDEFSSESSTSTIADIQGAEMVGDHTDSTKYWVLWRLNKAVHDKNMEKFVDAASNQYEGFLETSKNDPVQQLQFLVPAYEAVIKVVGVYATFEGKNLKTEIPNQISSILNSLRLESDGEIDMTGQVGYPLSKPLKVRVSSPKGMTLSDIPIIYTYEKGEGIFSSDLVFTSGSGKASTSVTEVISRKRDQQVRASIDLKEMREDRLSKLVSFEKRLDLMTETNSVIFRLDVAQVTQEKIAVIVVGDTAIYNESDLKRLNRSFRSEFVDGTDFKIKDEALIEPIIQSYQRSNTLCSSTECQIEIGKKLGVEKLIFVDVANYSKETSVTIFLRNIANKELVLDYTYPFSHDKDASKNDKIDIIVENIPDMVEDFWIKVNPASLTITMPRRQKATAIFTVKDPTAWMDKTFQKRLPLRNANFLEGQYHIKVEKPGYELFEKDINIAMEEDYDNLFIDLNQKTPGRAFMRSLIVPGRGQTYTSDAKKGRKTLGTVFKVLWGGALVFTGSSWASYSSKKSDYEDANNTYLAQKMLDDVQMHSAIAEQKNKEMLDQQTMALAATGLLTTIWLGSALEAMFNFPDYQISYRSTDIEFALLDRSGEIAPGVHVSYRIK